MVFLQTGRETDLRDRLQLGARREAQRQGAAVAPPDGGISPRVRHRDPNHQATVDNPEGDIRVAGPAV